MIYGLPVPEGPRTAAPTRCHTTPRAPLDPGAFDPVDPTPFADDPTLVAMLAAPCGRLLPCPPSRAGRDRALVYDNSADGDFVLDRVGHVVVAVAQWAPVQFEPLLGELLADRADGTEPPSGLGRFGLRRAVAAGAPAAG